MLQIRTVLSCESLLQLRFSLKDSLFGESANRMTFFDAILKPEADHVKKNQSLPYQVPFVIFIFLTVPDNFFNSFLGNFLTSIFLCCMT